MFLERMTSLIPANKLPHTNQHIIAARPQPFEMLYSLNCQNLCGDFHEDLNFRFSWGITSMITRFTSNKSIKEKNSNGQMMLTGTHNGNNSLSVRIFTLLLGSGLFKWFKLFLDTTFNVTNNK